MQYYLSIINSGVISVLQALQSLLFSAVTWHSGRSQHDILPRNTLHNT